MGWGRTFFDFFCAAAAELASVKDFEVDEGERRVTAGRIPAGRVEEGRVEEGSVRGSLAFVSTSARKPSEASSCGRSGSYPPSC